MRNGLFLLLILTGCATRSPNPVPVPVPPRAIQIEWRFETYYLDELEVSYDGGQTWRLVSGPYPILDDLTRYVVRVDATAPAAMFRLRRDWGLPMLSPEVLSWLVGDLPEKPKLKKQNQ